MTPDTSRDHADCLIDQLLREVLGGDRPRDLTSRVLVQAKAYDKTRRWWWAGAAMSMAASVAIIATVWAAWPRAYPAAVAAKGSAFDTSGNGLLDRGSVIKTNPGETAQFTFGGYVRVAVAPDTYFRIGGDKFQEKLLLDYGHLDIGVDKKIGTFEVAVGTATVHVTGTHFSVDAFEEADQAHRIKKMKVIVTDGSVLVDGLEDGKAVTLNASTKTAEQIFKLWTEDLSTENPTPGTTPGETRGGNPPAVTPAVTPASPRGGSIDTHVAADGTRTPSRSGSGSRGFQVNGVPPTTPERTPPSVIPPAPPTTPGPTGSPPPPEGAEPQAPAGQP